MSSINPDISLIDEALNKEDIYKYSLSIRISSEEFLYCILDTKINKYLALESYLFKKIHGKNTISDKIDEIFKQIGWLKGSFKSIKIIYVSQKSTIIPVPLFEEKEKETYLNFNNTINEKEIVFHDKLKNP